MYCTGIAKPHKILVNTFFVSVFISFFVSMQKKILNQILPRYYLNDPNDDDEEVKL